MTLKKLFFLALLVGFVGATGYAFYLRHALKGKDIKPVVEGVFVSEQVSPEDMGQIRRLGIKTIIDLRPDGEAEDQPSAETMRLASEQSQIGFIYNPIPHGEIPEEGVVKLAASLTDSPKPILMYCRSGKRAVRTFCLAEAGQQGGPRLSELLQVAKDTGFDATDLADRLTAKINGRGK